MCRTGEYLYGARKSRYIIDSNLATFLHAGMKPGSLEEQDYEYCLTAQAFANEKHRFDKMVIVGHWPSSNYRDKWIEKSKDGILVKRDGIVGNYFGNYEFV